jgi:hypothetical protein
LKPLETDISDSSYCALGSPCDFFIQILKRNNPKECAISSQRTAQGHIITATLALKSRARNCSKHGFIAF